MLKKYLIMISLMILLNSMDRIYIKKEKFLDTEVKNNNERKVYNRTTWKPAFETFCNNIKNNLNNSYLQINRYIH